MAYIQQMGPAYSAYSTAIHTWSRSQGAGHCQFVTSVRQLSPFAPLGLLRASYRIRMNRKRHCESKLTRQEYLASVRVWQMTIRTRELADIRANFRHSH